MKSYKGWYKLVNPEKFISPIDTHMKSYNESTHEINYKSRLELTAFKYADFNKYITRWSIEPFPIYYIKPTDGKSHRYYIDLYLEFSTGDKFLVEVKPKSETLPPKKPKKMTKKSDLRYQRAVVTYSINQAKWKATQAFGEKNNMKFITLTDKELC